MAFHLLGPIKNTVEAIKDFSEGNNEEGCKNLVKATVGAVIPFGGLIAGGLMENENAAIHTAHNAWEHRDDIMDSIHEFL